MASIPNSSTATPWFGVSMLLIGAIVGYGASAMTGGSVAIGGGNNNDRVADAPSVPSAPSAPAAAPSVDNVVPVSEDDDHIRGDAGALISVIEYSDFECPFCQRHHPTMQAMMEEVDDVNWVYRHYPLSFHPNAQKAAEASECAAEQGKFWEYADILFEKGSDNTQLVTYAEELDLDKDEFETCLSSGKFNEKIADQMSKGSAAGVSGTPGNIVINNETGEARLISGAQGLEAFKATIEDLRE